MHLIPYRSRINPNPGNFMKGDGAGTFPKTEGTTASRPAASPRVIRRVRSFWKAVFFRVLR